MTMPIAYQSTTWDVNRDIIYFSNLLLGKVKVVKPAQLSQHHLLCMSSRVSSTERMRRIHLTMPDPQEGRPTMVYLYPNHPHASKPFPRPQTIITHSNQLLHHLQTINLAIKVSALVHSSAQHTHLFAGLTPTLNSSILPSFPTPTWLRVILPADTHPSAVRRAFSRSASRG
jgi:hypothetical protein